MPLKEEKLRAAALDIASQFSDDYDDAMVIYRYVGLLLEWRSKSALADPVTNDGGPVGGANGRPDDVNGNGTSDNGGPTTNVLSINRAAKCRSIGLEASSPRA
jgi:hypothetical protein